MKHKMVNTKSDIPDLSFAAICQECGITIYADSAYKLRKEKTDYENTQCLDNKKGS